MFTNATPKPAPSILYPARVKNGQLRFRQITLSLPGDASLTVTGHCMKPNCIFIWCRVAGGKLDALIRCFEGKGEGIRYEPVLYHTIGRGPLADDPTLNSPMESYSVPLDAIEAIIARCYAHLRDEARRLDRERGYGGPPLANGLAARWLSNELHYFYVTPVPRFDPRAYAQGGSGA